MMPIALSVSSGQEVLKHYASLVGYLTSRFERPPELEIRFYPDAAATVADWTGLSSLELEPVACVVLGHAEEFGARSALREGSSEILLRNDYLTARQLRAPKGRAVVLMSFEFSFWGDIAGHIAAALYAAGASELIYLGKVGALTRGIELYRRLVIPASFMLAEHDRVLVAPFSVVNGMADVRGAGGLHVSTPTILEQSHLQRAALSSLEPRTIDNEITHMALAAARHGKGVQFSSVSFATDYVRSSADDALPTEFDLSNNRTARARHLRQWAIIRAAAVLDSHLGV